MPADMIPVESSYIRAIGRDDMTGLTHVQFRSGGGTFKYELPQDAHDAFVNAESHGQHFHQFIKGAYDPV